tara:strand:- start:6822 stop:7049 length:228 start_codon:yes stop_codon:yes gene_type:complete
MNNQFFSINLVKKKSVTKKSKPKTTKKRKKKKQNQDAELDSGIVIVDDDFDIDKNVVNEERRAYLEEARSQDASE